MFEPSTIAVLRERLRSARGPVRVAAVPVTVDPVAFLRGTAGMFSWAGYLGSPTCRVAGVGTARRWVAGGEGRLQRLAGEVAASGIDPEAVLLTGFSFSPQGPRHPSWDGFASAVVVLPSLAVVRDRHGARLVAAAPPGVSIDGILDAAAAATLAEAPRVPDAAAHVIEAHPAPAVWREQVAEAVAAIDAGVARKIVLARSVEIGAERIDDPFGLVAQLEAEYPGSYVYGWQEGDAVFLGASPELLVGKDGSRVVSHPHAGSARRGADAAEDRRLGLELLASAKNRSEHDLVVGDIVGRLAPRTDALDVPTRPTLRPLANVQHLATRIEGELSGSPSVLELAGDLHPTPAVGGMPHVDALAFIDKIEQIDRGWYAGGIGYLNPGGDGEVAVSVRCGLLRDNRAVLYAGNGIVAGSDPEAELAESRLKLRPLLNLLAAT